MNQQCRFFFFCVFVLRESNCENLINSPSAKFRVLPTPSNEKVMVSNSWRYSSNSVAISMFQLSAKFLCDKTNVIKRSAFTNATEAYLMGCNKCAKRLSSASFILPFVFFLAGNSNSEIPNPKPHKGDWKQPLSAPTKQAQEGQNREGRLVQSPYLLSK